MRDEPCISRIDQEDKCNHGYYVRVSHRGTEHRKWFGDIKCGGPTGALDAAIEWRDAKIKSLDGKTLKPWRQDVPQSGVPGVKHVVARHASATYEYWCAQHPDAPRTVRFSVGKFGFEEALRLAIEQRREFELEVATA